jgi:KipI family sensor histidine kinase inhibitor
MNPSVPEGELRQLGDRAFLIGVADAAAARLLAGALGAALAEDGEVVSGAATVLVRAVDADAELGPLLTAADAVRTGVRRGGPSADLVGTGRLVTIPCRFDGPDLPEVAALAGCRSDEVAELLTRQPLTAAVIGFSPGFAYLEGLPAPLRDVPRRARPRAAVPAGSVAIANGHAAVYPTASPGGWHLIGRTAFPLFTTARPPYAVLAPGDRVHFAVAGEGEPFEPDPVKAPPWSLPGDARTVFDVQSPGLRAAVQDGGRHAVAAAGVPAAGPADPVSFELANRVVGNSPRAATLELTGGGTRLTCLGACHVAVVGAAPDVRVDHGTVPTAQLLPLGPGQTLEVGHQHGGWRSYLAVAGGFLGPEWFGSSATDELTGLGAGPLAPGDVLRAGAWSPPLGDHVVADGAIAVDAASVVDLRVVPGPHAERFEADALTRLAGAVFVVQPESNRVGIRLRAAGVVGAVGPRGGTGRGGLDSQGVVTGAVQVPPDGDPVVLGPDHATLGGYPVLAVVASADLGRLGQCAPGSRVRFVPVTLEEADEARRTLRRALSQAVAGTYPLAVD